VYDADHRAKALMTTDGILMSQIRKEFGDLSYDGNGNLNRAYLASSVFAEAEKLGRLNALVHPRVGVDYKNWVDSIDDPAPYVLKEAALLFEAGSYKELDKVIVVYAPAEIRLNRVMNRDPQRTPDQVQDIMSRQWPDEEKVKRADYILTNDESVLLIPQVISLHQKFLELY
jgi:dephospho-CoA kinase